MRRVWPSRLLVNLATAAVTIGFSYIALSGIKVGQAWHALRASNALWLAPALAAFALGVIARGLRWRSLFASGRRPTRGVVMNAMMIGYLYNNILPVRAGEAARVLTLTRRSETAPVEIVGTVVLERIYDVVTILVIFFVAEPWLPHVSWFGAAAVVAIVLAAGIVAAAGVLAVYGDRPVRLLLRPLHRFPRLSSDRLERTIDELVHGLSGLRHPAVALEAFVWSLAGWMFSALCAYFVTLSFHLHVSFAAGVLVIVAVGLSQILPAAPGSIGVFEGATLIGLKAFHIAHAAALPCALVLHAVNFVPYVAVGVLVLHHNARRPVPARSAS